MKIKTLLKIAAVGLPAFFLIGMVTKRDILFDCAGQYHNEKSKTINLRVHLSHSSPLYFWEKKHGLLQTKDQVFQVKEEFGVFALYKFGKYSGSLDADLLEIVIDLPNSIFEGQCSVYR